MGIYLDEPLAVMAAAGIAVVSGAVGAWWQRRRVGQRPAETTPREFDVRPIEARFDRLEQLVETTAVEVERIAEGQRFTTKLLAERSIQVALPPVVPAQPAEYRTPH